MSENSKHKNFLAYLNNPMSIESIMVIYDANNVTFQKCELYSDFIQSLLCKLFDTYMGDDVTDLDSQTKHFKWCWEKNIENFIDEGFNFENPILYDYFLEFMLEVFYTIEKKDYPDKSTIKLWFDLFDYSKIKTNSEMDTFIEIYSLFESSLKKV